MKNINEIYKYIPKRDMDSIINSCSKENRMEYVNALCECIYTLRDIKGLSRVIVNYIKEFQNGYKNLNRSFIHILFAYRFYRYKFLKELETGSPPVDFALSNNLDVELTRFSDTEEILNNRIIKTIKNNLQNYSDCFIEIRLKSLEIKKIIYTLKIDLKTLIKKKYIHNKFYTILIKPRNVNMISMNVIPNKDTAYCLSSEKEFSIAVEFRKEKINLLDCIFDKNKKEACKNSQVLILDFTNSLFVKNAQDLEKEFKKIKSSFPANNLAVIIGIRFYFNKGFLQRDYQYLIRGKEDDRIKQFNEGFLKLV